MLNAVDTEVIALARLIASVDSVLDVVVMSAMTLAICAKLGLVLNSLAISARVSKLEGAFPIMLDNAAFNALVAADISLVSVVESPDTTTDNDGNDTSNAAETDPTWLVRTDTSVEMTPLSVVFKLTRWETAVLALVDKDEIALIRVDVSDEIAVDKLEFVEVTVDAFVLTDEVIAFTSLVNATDSVLNADDMVWMPVRS